jgi:proteasome maturation protein
VPKAAHANVHDAADVLTSGSGLPAPRSAAMPGLADPLRARLLSSATMGSSGANASSTVAAAAAAAGGAPGAGSAVRAPLSAHPLEARLKNWAATQEALRMQLLRRTFGMAEPVRRGMELRIVGAGEWRPACLGGSAGVGADVLRGTDTGDQMAWEDVFTGKI